MVEGVAAVSEITQSFLAPPTNTEAQPVSAESVNAFEYNLEVREPDLADWREIPDTQATGGKEFDRNDGGIGSELVSAITDMDANYRDAISRIQNWPGFGSYLEKHGIELGEETTKQTASHTHVTNIDDARLTEAAAEVKPAQMIEDGMQRLNALSEKSQAYYQAGMEYEYDSAKWFLTTEFWMTKIKILTSAVSQVGTSLKTLFNSQ